MADNSSNNSSGPRNWRDRVGVKGGMPKLADEFKNEPKIGANPASEQPRQPAPPPSERSVGRPAPKPIARPAPMAPRRPKPADPAPTRPAAARPATPSASGAAASAERSNAFAERLRAQREAAEALAKKRAIETRERVSGAATTSNGPKFSFSDEEIQAAAQERTVPEPAPAPAPPPRPPFRPRHTDAASSAPPAYQPSDAYRQTHGYREYDETPVAPTQAAPRPPTHSRYADAENESQTGYTPPSRGEYQAPRTRDARYGDDGLFDDRPEATRDAPRRAGASDYSAAYRDYDDAFDYDEEPRSRGGIWVFVVLMLIVVAAIAAVAYYFINYGTAIGAKTPTNGNVPTVSAPENPVKVAPNPVDTAPPGTPVRRKKIYDRILGNETLEPEKLVPSEETPQTPPPVVIPEAAPTGEVPTSIQPLPLPLPPPPTLPGVQGSIDAPASPPGAGVGKTNKVAGVTSGSGKTGQTVIAPTAAQTTSTITQSGGQQAPLALPPATTQGQTDTADATPVAGPAPTSGPVTSSSPPLPRRKPAALIARARQAAEQSRLAALTRSVAPTVPSVPVAPRQALTGTGPVQLTPGTTAPAQNFGAPAAPTVPHQQRTNIASLPQPTPPVATPQQPAVTGGSGYVLQMATFRNRNAASAEYRRLISRHAGILRGLSPQITEGDLGVSGKFYKLRLGSVASRGQASQLCNALIAAGEKDCLVRSR